ncbi:MULTISPECIES: GpE family phage tail protein [Acinetobacter]|nr:MULTISPECIES: GpE family phage tail protein [Acinetobacter]MDC5111909.1 GpE family phage tail protein [Acinetobacter baumannii]
MAVVFHWTPADCADFDLDELMYWQELAIKRTQTEK